MSESKTLEERRRELLRKAADFEQLFETPTGKKVLEHLEAEFNPVALFSDNPHRTSYNTGRRDVVEYIKEMMRASKNATKTTI